MKVASVRSNENSSLRGVEPPPFIVTVGVDERIIGMSQDGTDNPIPPDKY